MIQAHAPASVAGREYPDADGTPTLQESANGAQRNPLPHDRFHYGSCGDARVRIEVQIGSGAIEFYRRNAGVKRIRGLLESPLCKPRPQWENLLETISELAVGKRPGRQEKCELKRRKKLHIYNCAAKPIPKPLHHSSLGLMPVPGHGIIY